MKNIKSDLMIAAAVAALICVGDGAHNDVHNTAGADGERDTGYAIQLVF